MAAASAAASADLLLDKKFSIGLKGLWGQGVGRYGDSTIADVTIRPDGIILRCTASRLSAPSKLIPNQRLSLYFNYGGDYVDRDYSAPGSRIGYGIPDQYVRLHDRSQSTADRFNPANPANCGGNNKDVQEVSFGYWYNFYNGPMGRFARASSTATSAAISGPARAARPIPAAAAARHDNIIDTSLPLLSAVIRKPADRQHRKRQPMGCLFRFPGERVHCCKDDFGKSDERAAETNRARHAPFLREQTTFSLATTGEHGQPCVAPLFYIVDKELSLYWLSSRNSLHSRNREHTPRAAATVYRAAGNWREIRGVQLRGTVSMVTDPCAAQR